MKSFWRTTFSCVLALAMFAGTAKAEAKADTSLDNEVEHYLENNSGQGGAPADFRVFWKDGIKMESGDGNFTFHLRGRMYFDMDWADSDDNIPSDLGENHVGFSTVRLGAEGTMYKNTSYKLEVSFDPDGEISLKDVFIGLKNVGPGDLVFGHMKRPFGLDELTSSRYISFTSRAPSSDAFTPGRDAGIAWFANFTESKKVHLGVGTFFNTDSEGDNSGQGGWGFTLRVAGLAMENADKDMLLEIGVSFQWQNLRMDGQSVTYSGRSGSSLAGDTLSVTVSAENEIRYAFEIAFKVKSIHIQAEFFWATPSATVGDDPTFFGYYAQVGWFITGESRAFSKKRMTWTRTAPKANFWTGDGGRGAWEVTLRWDTLDLADSGYDGGEQNQLSVSVNWYWNPNARMMMTYYNNDSTGSTDATLNSVVLRWQFDF